MGWTRQIIIMITKIVTTIIIIVIMIIVQNTVSIVDFSLHVYV